MTYVPLGIALSSVACFIVIAQPKMNPSKATTFTIDESNADLLKKLKDYPNLEVLSIQCLESLKALPDEIGV